MLNTIAAKVLILDNNDSFTWNLVELLRSTGRAEVSVWSSLRHHLPSLKDIDGLILSPGPGLPGDFPMMNQLLREWAGRIPILGVCLGHQAIALAYGGSIRGLQEVRHGKAARLVMAEPSQLFHGIEGGSLVGLYHSWAVCEDDLPGELCVTARDNAGVVMGLRHRTLAIEGVQFHPESVISRYGVRMLNNWLGEL
jgi:anthranilate synthase component 2